MPVFLDNGDSPNIVKTYTLEGTAYDFRFKWNSMSECWHCFVGRAGQPPSCKFKLTVGSDLLAPYKYSSSVPDGVLYLYDLISLYGKPGRDNLGVDKQFRLVYYNSNEV